MDIGLYIKVKYLENKSNGKLEDIKTQKEINSKKTANIKNNGTTTGTIYDINTMTYKDFKKLPEEEQDKIVNQNYSLYEKMLAQANQ